MIVATTITQKNEFHVPRKEFYGVCRQWANDKTKAKYKDFSAEELHIYEDTGEIVPERTTEEWFTNKRPTSFRVKLQYKNKFIYLWKVTWNYVVRNVMRDLERTKQRT